MKDYEGLIAFKANIADDRIEALLSRFAKKISDNGGEFEKSEGLGQRKFAFRLQKHKGDKEGRYYLIKFKGEGKTPSALRDELRVQEEVLRYTIAKISEAEKALIEKVEALEAPKEEVSGQPQ